MKILYIKLKNFSNITTCMKTDQIEIDFSQSKNKIILLEGPNGTGKTSILSTLHPFATNGSLDVRSSLTPIVEGINGYKEIHIEDNGNIYIIKHDYIPNKETHSIKSYISRNGEELNPNGNVTSFKEIVKENLDLEMDFLKLIRLGSNVTNFIEMKTTERKGFMGKLLDEIDLFLQYFKKTTSDLREMKSIISHVSDKLSKINISSTDEVENQIDILHKKINVCNETLMKMKSSESVLIYKISQLPSIEDIMFNLKTYKDKSDKIKKKFDSNISVSVSDISQLKESLVVMKSKLETYVEKKSLYLDDLDRMLNNLHDFELQLEKEENNEHVISLKQIIADLNEAINEKEDMFKTFNPNYTVLDVEAVINAVYASQNILNVTYEFGKGPVSKVIKNMKNNKNIPELISEKLSVIENNKLQNNAKIIMKIMSNRIGKVEEPDCKVRTKCSVYKMWQDLISLSKSKTVIEDDSYDEEFYNYMSMAYTNIKNAIAELNKVKKHFEKMPDEIKEMFLLDNVYKNISSLSPIYDINKLYDTLSIIKEYEIYLSKKRELVDRQYELDIIEKNSNKEKLSNSIEKLRNDIEDRKNQLSILQKDLSELQVDIEINKDKLRDLEELKDLIDNTNEINEELNKYHNMFNEYNHINDELDNIRMQINSYELDLKKLNNDLNDLEFKKKEFKSLNKELKKLNKKYDDGLYIRKALSTKEGMPLYFIKIYLKNTAKITNELLDIAYNGDLTIDDFNINESEFSIPYFKNGKRIPDAIYASQGERSFISLTLSFALSYQSLSRYNVMLLDEIDSTLDTSNRMKFISIIQKLMDMIGSEQIFLITHNNMFDMYPVDVISTTNEKGNNKLANYINIDIA